MSQAMSAGGKRRNCWWGLGAAVESQSIALGVNTTLVRMFAFSNSGESCVIRLSGIQIGPGLGGGGDLALVIATGIATPAGFLSVRTEGGWDFSLRDVVSATSTPKSCLQLAHLVKTVPMSEILDYTVKNPSYVLKLRDAVGGFRDAVIVGADAVMDKPRLWTFALVGVGFQLSLTYRCANRTTLLTM